MPGGHEGRHVQAITDGIAMRVRRKGLGGSIRVAFAFLAGVIHGGISLADPGFDDTLRSVVGVRMARPGGDASEGMGVHVGEGRVLTVAQLFDGEAPGASVDILASGGGAHFDVHIEGRLESIDRPKDAAIVKVAESAPLQPLSPCEAPRTGDRASVLRLSAQDSGSQSDGRARVLEIDDRFFVKIPQVASPVLPGAVADGFSGSPALDQSGTCFHGIVSGRLSSLLKRKDPIRRFQYIVLIGPAVFTSLLSSNPDRAERGGAPVRE
jgi:hypothetical protein